MIRVKVVTVNNRGFIRNLFDYKYRDISFVYDQDSMYEIPSVIRKKMAEVIKWPIFDFLGIFKIIKNLEVKEDICFSYNRFLKTNKPYVILLENPSALVNYSWDRPKHLLAKKKLNDCFSDPMLKGIVCMSSACYKYLPNLYELPEKLSVYQNYPLIMDDDHYLFGDIKKKFEHSTIKLLFVSADFELKGGRDLLLVHKRLKEKGFEFSLSIITKKDGIRNDDLQYIKNTKNINLIEFNLSKTELNQYYMDAAILVNPTRWDSFNLVTLEAIKYGCAVVATDMYAIKEMVRDGYNGYLETPMYKLWDEDGKMNKYYRTHQKKCFYDGHIDTKLVDSMEKHLSDLLNNRKKLEIMCENSFSLSREGKFSEKYVVELWNEILRKGVEQ